MYIKTADVFKKGSTRHTHRVKPHIRNINGKKVKVKGHTRHAHGVKRRKRS